VALALLLDSVVSEKDPHLGGFLFSQGRSGTGMLSEMLVESTRFCYCEGIKEYFSKKQKPTRPDGSLRRKPVLPTQKALQSCIASPARGCDSVWYVLESLNFPHFVSAEENAAIIIIDAPGSTTSQDF
jgi:hypothetical protein